MIYEKMIIRIHCPINPYYYLMKLNSIKYMISKFIAIKRPFYWTQFAHKQSIPCFEANNETIEWAEQRIPEST